MRSLWTLTASSEAPCGTGPVHTSPCARPRSPRAGSGADCSLCTGLSPTSTRALALARLCAASISIVATTAISSADSCMGISPAPGKAMRPPTSVVWTCACSVPSRASPFTRVTFSKWTYRMTFWTASALVAAPVAFTLLGLRHACFLASFRKRSPLLLPPRSYPPPP